MYEIGGSINGMYALLIEPRWNIALESTYWGKVIENTYISAHHPLAFISIWSNQVNIKRYDLKNFKAIDIVPTILYSLNLPIPSYGEGRILDVFIRYFSRKISKKDYRIRYRIRRAKL